MQLLSFLLLTWTDGLSNQVYSGCHEAGWLLHGCHEVVIQKMPTWVSDSSQHPIPFHTSQYPIYSHTSPHLVHSHAAGHPIHSCASWHPNHSHISWHLNPSPNSWHLIHSHISWHLIYSHTSFHIIHFHHHPISFPHNRFLNRLHSSISNPLPHRLMSNPFPRQSISNLLTYHPISKPLHTTEYLPSHCPIWWERPCTAEGSVTR